ncbi:hypothetical protein STCU_04060 [Strigomonas culicis]|uniref:Kelch repeat-containing protein n=1 Tax=Strigomonas culicis TaxID=28005 RepID=S9W3L6_9TRYP|nr:hypothetical protein STCU_04060 [Strigomonas culicis]|eukprot:EPY30450.1 hypothetical protein STCU_04060 [Strigomonas culicis]
MSEKHIYVVGGCDAASGKPLQQVLECERATAPLQWRRSMDMPQALCDAVAVVSDSNLFVLGGTCHTSLNPYLYVFDTAKAGALWQRLPPAGTYAEHPRPVPSARIGHAMVEGVYRSEPVLYLFGGHDGTQHVNDIWRLHVRETLRTQEAVWEMVDVAEGLLPSAREGASLSYSQEHDALFVFGGSGRFFSNECYVLEMQDGSNRWVQVPTVGAPSPRRESLSLVHGSRLFLLGGTDAQHAYLPQLCVLDLGSMRFYTAQLGRHQQECVAEGATCIGWASAAAKAFILFGGTAGNSLFEIRLEPFEQVAMKKK